LDSLFKDVFAGNRCESLCGLALDRCASLAQELVADFVLVDELRNLDQVMALEANTNPVLVLDAYRQARYRGSGGPLQTVANEVSAEAAGVFILQVDSPF
jgi:hypothetical protein